MHAVLYSTLAVIAWLATAYRLLALRRRQATPARYAVIGSLGLLAVTFTASVPAVWVLLDRITGVNNIAALIAHLCVVGFATVIEVLLIWWANPAQLARRRARVRLVGQGAVVIILVSLFVLAGPFESRQTDFVASYADHPPFALYLLAYLAAFASGLIDIVRLCWPYSSLVDRGSLRLGLRTTAVGAGVGLVYCAARGLDVVGVAVGWDVRRWEFVIPLSSSTGAFLVIVGLTMPAWGPRLSAWIRTIRTYRQLRPLWIAIASAVPAVRLVSGHRTLRPRLKERLHRRVVEIYDGRLVLRPYLDEAIGDDARRRGEAEGLAGPDLDAVVEAAKIKVALHRMRTESKPERPEQPAEIPHPTDEAHEMAHLASIARSFVDSPIVASYADTASSASAASSASTAHGPTGRPR